MVESGIVRARSPVIGTPPVSCNRFAPATRVPAEIAHCVRPAGALKRPPCQRCAAGFPRVHGLLITHFHGDHHSGVSELAQLLPIETFIDHGTVAAAEKNAGMMGASMPTSPPEESVLTSSRNLAIDCR